MNSFSDYLKKIGEIGYITRVTKSGIIYCDGLPNVSINEVVVLESGEFGKIFAIGEMEVTILIFSLNLIKVGTSVARTNKSLGVPVSEQLLGLALNPLCQPFSPSLDFKKPTKERLLDVTPVDIISRVAIKNPLPTGVSIVDMLIPLGAGQRELIIGNRKVGKTNFLLKTVLTQAEAGMICIWAAIGKKLSEIKAIEEYFIQKGVMKNIIIIACGSEDANALLYITPFTAITIAEYFRDLGKDTLVVLDDLTSHARFCREIALLAKQFPGRDSYPVDIFYTHAKLLERAGNFVINGKEVSITALIAAETNNSDLSGYIQTNLMSMTDGHIFFDAEEFEKGKRPAINPYLSVTRVGHQAQPPLRREISKALLSFLAQYEKLESFIHFGAELSAENKEILETGNKITEIFLRQNLYEITPINLQLTLFCLFWLKTFNHQNQLSPYKTIYDINLKYTQDAEFKATIDKIIVEAKELPDFLKQINTFLSGQLEVQNNVN